MATILKDNGGSIPAEPESMPVFRRKPCGHEPDLTTMTLADVEQEPREVIYDVACLHCGRSGAFRLVSTDLTVDW